LRVGVNGDELNGEHKTKPINYRISPSERLEIRKPLFQDPNERRKNKCNLGEGS